MIAKPLISIVVTIDFKDKVEDFLNGFLNSGVDQGGYQIIIVEGVGFKYPFVKKEKKYFTDAGSEVQVIRLNKAGRARQRNEAIRRASADVVLLCAGDFVPLPDSIKNHLLFHTIHPELNKVAIGPGIFKKGNRTPFMEWLEDTGTLFGLPFLDYTHEQPVDFFYGANTSVKREFLTQAGEFYEGFKYDACEDFDMGLRLKKIGMQSYIVPSTAMIHEHDVTIDQRVMLLELAGRSTVMLDLRHQESFPWVVERTTSIRELKKMAKENYGKYKYSQELSYLHRYYELISRIAFCKGYQRELKKINFR